MAESFKFGKMSKKQPFFPTLYTRGFLQTENLTSFDNGLPYLDGRDKESLLFPNKVKDYSKTFGLQKTCDGNFFTKPIGQEIDRYDEVMVKFMKTQDRGL